MTSMAFTVRRALGRLRVAAVQRRFSSFNVDELDLDEEPVTKEASPEVETEEEEGPARPRKLYTFGCILNGRTGTNVRNTDLHLFPLTAQKPSPVSFLDDFKIKKIVGYYKHFLAITECGRVFAWGSNNCGQLGCGDEQFPMDRHAPVLVRKEDGTPLTGIVEASAGKYHSAAVDSEGRVFTWGYGGRRGFLNFTPGHLLAQPARRGVFYNYTPWASPIPDFGPEAGMEVESADNPFEEGKQLNPKAVKVSCGAIHTIVLDSLGRAWTWGYGEWGRLGQEDNEDRVSPTPVTFFLDERTGLPRIPLSDVSACENVTTFLTSEGSLYVCGSDASRQLGFGAEEQGLRTARFEAINLPHNVAGLTNIKQAALGSHSAVAVSKVGTPYYWGGAEPRGPQAFTTFGQRAKQKIAKVAVGTGLRVDHRAFVTTDGLLYLTGANIFGQSLAATRPRDPDASAVRVLMRYLRSWRPTYLNTIDIELQTPLFFKDKKVIDVACGHSSTVVLAEDMTDAEIEKRNEMLDEAIEEFKEAQEKRKTKGKKDTSFGRL